MPRQPKVAYTWRTHYKPQLQAVAEQEHRTVSNTVNLAVKEFLRRRGLLPETQPPEVCK